MVAGADAANVAANLDNLADGLVAHGRADALLVDGAVVAVQVGAADGEAGGSDEGAVGGGNLGVGHVFQLDTLVAAVDERSHGNPPGAGVSGAVTLGRNLTGLAG